MTAQDLIGTNISWPEIAEGYEIPEIALDVTYEKVAGHIYVTRDWFPGHHNPDYARAQGKENIYANTMFFQGFFERLALGWAGPEWFVRRRTLAIKHSVYPGDQLRGTGRIVAKSLLPNGGQALELEVQGHTAGHDGAAISGELTIVRPVDRLSLL